MEGITFQEKPDGFSIGLGDRTLVSHRRTEPLIHIGWGDASFEMNRGNFRITEHLDELIALRDFEIFTRNRNSVVIRFSMSGIFSLDIVFTKDGRTLTLDFKVIASMRQLPNRFRITLPASASEHVFGCGEQFSFFDLKGRNFPLWTSEQGVGRNKGTEITRLADLDGGSGGDYFWTFFPQTSFVSSGHYWCHLDTTAYAEFDFRHPSRHELTVWEVPRRLTIGIQNTMAAVVSDLSTHFGRQGTLPEWCFDGIIIGVQGGTSVCLGKLAAARNAGVKVAGIWVQDWQGINMTSFGQRLRWNWVWDENRYPGLDKEIGRLKSEGVHFLGYINPYLGEGMSLFQEAVAGDFLAKNELGGVYLVDFGEFNAGIVDLTNPDAFTWYKAVIKKNLIGFGLGGWMADFGEYLPTDVVLKSGVSAKLAHNEWPVLWARCNREAVDEAEREGLAPKGELFFFMRAGGAGSQKYCPLMWAGDQNVDWSEDDGLPSVIPAALSLAVSGHGLHHSDIGGYTSLYGMKRTKELFMRWAEQAAFTVLMRNHEGNRPLDNWQFDSDEDTLAHLARMTAFHAALKPYLLALVRENSEFGLAVMRPLFLHHEHCEKAWTLKDEYMLGKDLLVAPIIREGAVSRIVHLPVGKWTHIWSGRTYNVPEDSFGGGIDVEVAAPLGEPPAFFNRGSSWANVFLNAANAVE
jgi:alpha-glucosidase